jgi:hypothetical protein
VLAEAHGNMSAPNGLDQPTACCWSVNFASSNNGASVCFPSSVPEEVFRCSICRPGPECSRRYDLLLGSHSVHTSIEALHEARGSNLGDPDEPDSAGQTSNNVPEVLYHLYAVLFESAICGAFESATWPRTFVGIKFVFTIANRCSRP